MTNERIAALVDRAALLIPVMGGAPNTLQRRQLTALAEDCEAAFLASCNRDDVPDAADAVLVQMILHRYAQLGAAGVSNQSMSGMSEAIASDWSSTIIRELKRFAKMRCI